MKPERNNPYHREGGVALITVLLVFAIATVIAGSIVERNFMDIRRMERQLVYGQTWQYALAGEAFARQVLYTDFADAQPLRREDIPERPGLVYKMTETFEQGELDVSIFDLQARFNINNLVGGTEEDNNRARQQFGRLLENLFVEPKAIEALLNWDDVHTVPGADTSGGSGPTAEQTHSWSSTNWLITHLSELYSLDGIDRETVGKLMPYLSALPPPVAVNVDTAPEPVQQAVTDTEVTTRSRYFMVYVRSTFADQPLSLMTVLYRHPETGRVRMLSRDRGGDYIPESVDNRHT